MAEEKRDQEKKENGGGDEKAGPVELQVGMHCMGCARKVKKYIKSFKGVENVEIDMQLNKIVVKGNVDPLKLCERVQSKSRRKTELISPLPKKEEKVAEEKEKKKDAGDQPVKEEEKKDSGEETVVHTVEEKKNEVSAPKYLIEHVYPPQIFSDENPNACSIM